jgi:pyrroloquinoline quinone biosynthesis protein E
MTSIDPPLAMLAEVTHRCPLQCPYCSNPLQLLTASQEMDTETWKSIFSQAAEMGVLQIHFSGGEPTVRQDLEKLVAHCEGLDLYCNLITSGVLLNKDRLTRLAAAGLQHVQLSFQAAQADNADRISAYPNSLEKKIEIGRLVGEIGLPLTVNAVMHRQNLDDLEALIDLSVELGAQRLEVAHVQYYGWGLRNRAALIPTRAQLDQSTNIVEAARERLKGRLVIDYVVPDYYARRPKSCMGGWARQFVNVTPNGKVLPCHAAEDLPGLTFDSLRDRTLADIWQKSAALNHFRGTDWMPEPCQSCDRRELDWGGCRCQAFALTGDAAVTDPVCELSPHHDQVKQIAEKESGESPPEFLYRRIGGAN